MCKHVMLKDAAGRGGDGAAQEICAAGEGEAPPEHVFIDSACPRIFHLIFQKGPNGVNTNKIHAIFIFSKMVHVGTLV